MSKANIRKELIKELYLNLEPDSMGAEYDRLLGSPVVYCLANYSPNISELSKI
ncbi:MAG: hypothetical protein ABFR05_06985 [Bacteroidota bacterium]